jgi:hypothetical protein
MEAYAGLQFVGIDLHGLDAHLYGFDECLPAWVTVGADVAHQTADVSESDLVLRVGDAEPATGAGVPEGPRSKARHAGRGQLVAKTEADVGPGCAAFDECLDLIGAGLGHETQCVGFDQGDPVGRSEHGRVHRGQGPRVGDGADAWAFRLVVRADFSGVGEVGVHRGVFLKECLPPGRIAAGLVRNLVGWFHRTRALPASGHNPRGERFGQAHPHVHAQRLGDQGPHMLGYRGARGASHDFSPAPRRSGGLDGRRPWPGSADWALSRG